MPLDELYETVPPLDTVSLPPDAITMLLDELSPDTYVELLDIEELLYDTAPDSPDSAELLLSIFDLAAPLVSS